MHRIRVKTESEDFARRQDALLALMGVVGSPGSQLKTTPEGVEVLTAEQREVDAVADLVHAGPEFAEYTHEFV